MKSQPGVVDGDWARCPVSGVEFQVQPHNPTVEHDGATYRVCCGGCAKKLAEDPSRFLSGVCT